MDVINKLVRFIIDHMPRPIAKLLNKFYRFIVFAVIGGINTVVDWICSYIAFYALSIPNSISTAIGYIMGLISSFFLNRSNTFKDSKGSMGSNALRFVLANAITMSCAMGIIEGLCALQVPYWAAKVISAPIVMVINYFGYKIFVFGIRDEVKALSKKHGVTLTDDTIDCGQTIEMLDGFLRSQAEFDAKMFILWCGFAGVVARDKNLSGDGIFIEIMSCIDTLDERVISIKGEKARDFLNDLAQSKMKDLKPEDVSSAALYMFNVGVRL